MSERPPKIPKRLYRVDQMPILEQMAMKKLALNTFDLMVLAGTAVFQILKSNYPLVNKLIIFVGSGNNAGDGYIVAAKAKSVGMKVEVIQLSGIEKLSGIAMKAHEYAKSSGVETRSFDAELLDGCSSDEETLIVDAILGVGINKSVTGLYEKAILSINAASHPVVSVDLPSGLNADTGRAMGIAVKADITVSFIGLKQGLLTGEGQDYSGQVFFERFDIPDNVYSSESSPKPSSKRIDINYVQGRLKPRKKSAHKGDHGHVVVLGGDKGFGGAGIMAAEAAQRAGAGLVTLVTRSEHKTAALVRCPELMVIGEEDEKNWGGILNRASCIVVGPGLGTNEWGRSILSKVIEQKKINHTPVLFDADALTLLTERENTLKTFETHNAVFTPHPGEAARLLGCSTEFVESDRFRTVKELVKLLGGTCLLKGSGSLTSSEYAPDIIYLCSEGNAGMASGGMGDVLSGIVASLIAQGLSCVDALNCGICIHGEAGDLASRANGERGLRATDLFPFLAKLLNTV